MLQFCRELLVNNFGLIVVSLLGWMVRELRRGISEYHESQEEQNKQLAAIQVELSGLKDFRNDSREQFKTSWSKIDLHDETLRDHEGRISRIEGERRQDPTVRTST